MKWKPLCWLLWSVSIRKRSHCCNNCAPSRLIIAKNTLITSHASLAFVFPRPPKFFAFPFKRSQDLTLSTLPAWSKSKTGRMKQQLHLAESPIIFYWNTEFGAKAHQSPGDLQICTKHWLVVCFCSGGEPFSKSFGFNMTFLLCGLVVMGAGSLALMPDVWLTEKLMRNSSWKPAPARLSFWAVCS